MSPERRHLVRLPTISDKIMCPVHTILQIKLVTTKLSDPVFKLKDGTFLTQSLLRKRLSCLLRVMHIPSVGYGFHSFRRTGASLAFNQQVPISSISHHGVWSSEAVWSYISDNTHLSHHVPLAFSSIFST